MLTGKSRCRTTGFGGDLSGLRVNRSPCRCSQAPRRSPAERRVEPGERGIDAPLTVMDRLVLHKLPREQREGKRGSVPIDRRVDVDGFQRGEQVSLLVIKRGEQRVPSLVSKGGLFLQRYGIGLVLRRLLVQQGN
jgi:hypothetical protein